MGSCPVLVASDKILQKVEGPKECRLDHGANLCKVFLELVSIFVPGGRGGLMWSDIAV